MSLQSPSTSGYSNAHLSLRRGNWAPADKCVFLRVALSPTSSVGDYGRDLSDESGELDQSLVTAPLPLPSQGFTLGSLEGPTSGRERC